ncbi:MAG: HNH endonuclease [Azonexus sp.]|nr:HNH endonuclease [Azonexus sp.]MBP8168181.1 HNH endonuclease [Azonexus sp.]
MILADLIHRETDVAFEQIMLLRHSSGEIANASDHSVSIEEYTAMQPTNSKYDFHHDDKPQISVVAVIVDDHVYGVYRIMGVEAEGTIYSLGSEAYLRFELARKKDDRPCRRFRLNAAPSTSIGLPVRGWEGGRARTAVQRYDSGFFRAIEVGPPDDAAFREAFEQSFQERVGKSLRDSSDARARRLDNANAIPTRIASTTYIFTRNPDVVAETLIRAKGVCQSCGCTAPFTRRSDGTPYLEVHHRQPLAQGGTDTVENAIALCPNCHRKSHYG